MATSVAEALEKLERARQELAVHQDVLGFLSRFVDTDVHETDQGIAADGCVATTVPQEVISEIIEGIHVEKVGPLMEEIDELVNLQVVESTVKPKKASETVKDGKPKVRRKAKAKKRSPRVRAVASQARSAG